MKTVILLYTLIVAGIPYTKAQDACTAEYAVQKFDMLSESYSQDGTATIKAQRYNLISLQVKLPGGEVPYVKKATCPTGTSPAMISDFWAISCSSPSTTNTLSGCNKQMACQQCMQSTVTYCCPNGYYGGKITFSDGVTKDGCADFNTNYALRSPHTETLVKYSDFYKNAYDAGTPAGSPGFSAEITGCNKENGDCGSSSGGPSFWNAMPMAPYKKDRLSNYFKYDNGGGGGEHPACSIHGIQPDQAYTPFSSAKVESTGSGCKLMVTLDDEDTAEELVSVDGVSMDCLKQLNIPYLKLALNILPALDSVTKAAPVGEEEIRVETKGTNGNVRTRVTRVTYAKYNAMLQRVTNVVENSYGRLPTCWTPNSADTDVWQCTSSSATCARASGYTRAVNDAKASAMANLETDVLTFLSFETLENLQTGAFQELTKNMWSTGKCKLKMSKVFDKDGNEVCDAPFEPTLVQPACAYSDMRKTTKELKDTLKKMSDGKMKSDTFGLAKYTSTDAWFSCADRVNKMQNEVIKKKTRVTSSCVLQMPNFCGETSISFCKKNPTNAWCNNPCCNYDLSRSKCCAPSEVTYDASAYEVNATEVAKRCATDENLNDAQVGTFVASAVTSAQSFVETSSKPEICFEDQEQLNKDFAKIRKMPACCAQSVLNTYENDGKSIQFCNSDADCYSGKCSSDPIPTTVKALTKDCFPDYEGKTKICSLVDDTNAGEPLGKCLVQMMTKYNNFPKALALVKKVFANNDQDANPAKIGQGIVNLIGSDSCVGGSTSYKYDPENWCQHWNFTTAKCEQICKGIACKPLCEAEISCNIGWNCKTSSCCTQKEVCGKKNPWGSGYSEVSSRDTKSKCEGGICNLKPWRSDIAQSECLSLPGECQDWNCLGCTDQSWQNRVRQVCFIPSVTETVCENRFNSIHSSYRNGGYVSKEYKDGCYIKNKYSWPDFSITSSSFYCNVTAGETYVAGCSSLSFDNCPTGVTWDTSNPINMNISKIMGCKPTGRARCKTQNECENSGYCSGGLRSDYYLGNGNTVYKPNVCVIPAPHGDWHCKIAEKECTPPQGSEWCWDNLAGHADHDHCYNARWNQSYCAKKGGTWKSTRLSKTSCEAAGQCQINGMYSELTSATECQKCGGELVPQAKWYPGKWMSPQYLTGSQNTNLFWLNQTLTQENRWKKKLYPWRFMRFMSRVEDILREESAATFSACLFGRQAHALETISAICGDGEGVDPQIISGLISQCVETAKVTAFKGVAETAGNLKESNLKLNQDTLPTNVNEAALSLCEETYIPESNERRRRRRRQRRLDQRMSEFRGLQEDKTGLGLDNAECYTVVKNSNGKLVGQLIGGCLKVEVAVAMANPAKLCLKLNDNIERNPKFTRFDFAIRAKDATTKAYKYTAIQATAHMASDLLCANITLNNVYCPIKTVANIASVTEDQGSNDCEALDTIINKVQSEKKKLKCKFGDSKSCEWFEPGSASFILGIGALIAIICGSIMFLISTYCCHRNRHLIKKHFTKKFFDSIDADGNGVLDAGEIKLMLKKEFGADLPLGKVKTLMRKFGAREMDFETYTQFVQYLKNIDESDHDQSMKDVLQKKVWKRKSVVELSQANPMTTKNPLKNNSTALTADSSREFSLPNQRRKGKSAAL